MSGWSGERRWVLGFALFLVLLTSLPYILAYAHPGASESFTGFLIGVEDGNSYIAKMRAGVEGDWLFRSPYTAAEQSGVLLYLPYLVLGKVAGSMPSHLSLVFFFHLFRIISIVALTFSTYKFVAYFLETINNRRLALALATLGGGLGWLLLAFGKSHWYGSLPLDFYSPETFGFLALFTLPHLVLARALMLWALLSYLKTGDQPPNARIAALWLALSFVHLLAAFSGLVVLALHLIASHFWRSSNSALHLARHRRHALWAAAGAAPVALINLWLFTKDPYLQQWAAQNQIFSPHPFHYIIAYGLFIPFAFLGARYLLRAHPQRSLLLASWLLAMPFLLYLPFGLQRRMSDGAWVALVILALAAFEKPGWLSQRHLRWLLMFAFPSTLILLWGSAQVARAAEPPAFRTQSEVAVFASLAKTIEPNALVLASFETSNALPAWALVRVLIGHGPESIGLATIEPRVAAFYETATLDSERIAFIKEFSIQYIFFGPNERKFGDPDLVSLPGISLFERSGDYAIYQVTPAIP
ncbi:MAG: hypothetical protein O3B43_05505 [Chloroflexi bacterium]|nr:hypothetical protein [Chloroflexota bacterium]